MSNWYEDPEFKYWRNRIEEIADSYEGNLEEDVKRLVCNYESWENDESFYFENIFPTVLKIFSAKVNLELNKSESQFLKLDTFEQRYDYLFSLVGTEIKPIVLSISAIQPKKVVFVHTSETGNQVSYIARMLRDYCDMSITKETLLVDEYKIEKISEALTSKISEIMTAEKENNETFNEQNMAFDITGGKKSMGNAAFALASTRGIDTYYVDFERYTADKPVPGTEFLNQLDNPIEDFLTDQFKPIIDKMGERNPPRILAEELDKIVAKPIQGLLKSSGILEREKSAGSKEHYFKLPQLL